MSVLETALGWLEAGQHVALASVVATEGSTPRPQGPALAVAADGGVAGSVSAGCVDAEVLALGERVLRTGEPVRASYRGSAPADLDGSLDVVPDDLVNPQPSILCGGGMTVEVRRLEQCDLPALRAQVEERHRARPELLVYGSTDIAVELGRLASVLGRRVTVCDQRPAFTVAERFPGADEVVVARPHEHLRSLVEQGRVDAGSAVVVLLHDARWEDPLLRVALASPAGYVGALGSRTTHAARCARLRGASVPEEQLARLRGPSGLDLGGSSPAQTALSILAEIVAVAHGGSGRPLTDLEGPLHRQLRGRP